MEMVNVLYVDFKDGLLNNRFSYYVEKPVDMQYDEDLFYGENYDLILEMVEHEYDFILQASE